MSGILIEDGAGSGKKAKVTKDGWLETFAISEDLLAEQLRQGKSFYVSAGANDWLAGTYSGTEYVMFEFYNNTSGNLLVQSAQVWLSPAYTTGPYTEVADQYCRFNQWLSDTAYLDSSGADGISANLNATSTLSLPARDNGNSSVRHAERADTVAIPAKTAAAGYICGFLTSSDHGKVEMLPFGQGLIIGRGQSWVVSCKTPQNSSPTNHIIGCRASVVDISAIEV